MLHSYETPTEERHYIFSCTQSINAPVVIIQSVAMSVSATTNNSRPKLQSAITSWNEDIDGDFTNTFLLQILTPHDFQKLQQHPCLQRSYEEENDDMLYLSDVEKACVEIVSDDARIAIIRTMLFLQECNQRNAGLASAVVLTEGRNYLAMELLAGLKYLRSKTTSANHCHTDEDVDACSPEPVIRISYATSDSWQNVRSFLRDVPSDNIHVIRTSEQALVQIHDGALYKFVDGIGLWDAPSTCEVHEGIIVISNQIMTGDSAFDADSDRDDDETSEFDDDYSDPDNHQYQGNSCSEYTRQPQDGLAIHNQYSSEGSDYEDDDDYEKEFGSDHDDVDDDVEFEQMVRDGIYSDIGSIDESDMVSYYDEIPRKRHWFKWIIWACLVPIIFAELLIQIFAHYHVQIEPIILQKQEESDDATIYILSLVMKGRIIVIDAVMDAVNQSQSLFTKFIDEIALHGWHRDEDDHHHLFQQIATLIATGRQTIIDTSMDSFLHSQVLTVKEWLAFVVESNQIENGV